MLPILIVISIMAAEPAALARAGDLSDSDCDLDLPAYQSSRYGLLLFYNLVLDEKKHKVSWHSQSVSAALGLDPNLWSSVRFSDLTFVDYCRIGVPTTSVVKAADDIGDVFTMTVCLVTSGRRSEVNQQIWDCHGAADLNYSSRDRVLRNSN